MKYNKLSVALGLVLGAATQGAVAGSWVDSLVPGVANTFEDANREIILDMDGNNELSSGDIFWGFVRLDDRAVPVGPDAISEPDNPYAVFGLQVESVTVDNDTYTVSYEAIDDGAASTAADYGLRFQDVVGSTETGAIAAMYEGINTNYIESSPGDVDGDGTLTIFDFIADINTADQVFTAGFSDDEDHWEAIIEATGAINPLLDLSQLANLGILDGIGTANEFHAGLEVLTVNFGPDYLDAVQDPVEFQRTGNILDITVHELTVQNGNISGANDLVYGAAGNPFFGTWDNSNANLLDINFFGASSDADINVVPVPEPSAIALMSVGLLSLGIYARRRRQSALG